MYLLPRLLFAFVLLSSPCWCWGQEHKATDVIQSTLIEAPDSVVAGRLISIKLPPNLPYTIKPDPENKLSFIDEESGKRAYLILEAKPPGYTITIDYAVVHPTDEELANAPTVPDPKNEEQVKAYKEYFRAHRGDEVYRDEHFVKVGKGPEPDPPGPDPDPDPEPDPDDPAPIPEDGFRVLILYETEMKEKLPELQKAIIFGAEVRDYLDKACVSEPDGGKGYRIYDKDQDATGDYPVWETAMQRRPESIPWVLISNGKTGYEGKLPESPSKFIELCKKHEVK